MFRKHRFPFRFFAGPSSSRTHRASRFAFVLLVAAISWMYSAGTGHALPVPPVIQATGQNDEWLGQSVANAGDVNGDGFSDVIVGAPHHGVGFPQAGAAFVYFGGPAADATPDVTFTGTRSDYFGDSVAGPGDLNGDGYADLLVGTANGVSNPTYPPGYAYVYFGGPNPDSIADLTLTGENNGDGFGARVSGAGDINGDGFPDVIVGAGSNDAAGSGSGRAYVYFGGTSIDAIPDLILTGTGANNHLGLSVSGVGM